MIRVHHLNDSRSIRAVWLLEELGLDYEIVPYRRQKNMLAPKSLRAIHPLGKSPVVEYEGRVLAESGAIIEELVERHGAGTLAPERGSDAYWRYVYWLHYGEGSLMPPLLLKLVLTKMGPLGWPAKPYVDRQIRLHLGYLEDELGKTKHFASDTFSGADIQLYFPLEAAASRGGLDGAYPRLATFVRSMRARPAYQRAVERGGALHLKG